VTTADLIGIATGNLRRMKLRTSLTTGGVVIAIGAFVAMLSFGAGMQQTIAQEFDQLGLLHTMIVYPNGRYRDIEIVPDTSRPLDSAALETLSRLPGVRLAYPYERFTVTAQFADTALTAYTQPLSTTALSTKLYSDLVAGRYFFDDNAHEALVTREFLKDIGVNDADSVIGDTVVIAVDVVSLDSAVSALVFHGDLDSIKARLRQIDEDSLFSVTYLRRIGMRELNASLGRFLHGYLNARERVSDTVVVVGAIERSRNRRRGQPIITTIAVGQRLSNAGFSGGPLELATSLGSGQLFDLERGSTGGHYAQVTLDLEPSAPYAPIRDSVTAMGYSVFSYAEEFEEIRRVFRYIDLALAMVGLIALATSSLGIVNTMLMSILERRREIGILKSLGADEGEIRLLFLFESGLIGLFGALGGLILGWTISRIGSFIARSLMEREGVTPVELFAVPIWLIGAALLLGMLVAVAAGYYPSSRAARVDAVEALRNE